MELLPKSFYQNHIAEIKVDVLLEWHFPCHKDIVFQIVDLNEVTIENPTRFEFFTNHFTFRFHVTKNSCFLKKVNSIILDKVNFAIRVSFQPIGDEVVGFGIE